jgi:hypothetical protein
VIATRQWTAKTTVIVISDCVHGTCTLLLKAMIPYLNDRAPRILASNRIVHSIISLLPAATILQALLRFETAAGHCGSYELRVVKSDLRYGISTSLNSLTNIFRLCTTTYILPPLTNSSPNTVNFGLIDNRNLDRALPSLIAIFAGSRGIVVVNTISWLSSEIRSLHCANSLRSGSPHWGVPTCPQYHPSSYMVTGSRPLTQGLQKGTREIATDNSR